MPCGGLTKMFEGQRQHHLLGLVGRAVELNVMEPVLVFNLLQSISIMTNVFAVFRKYLVEGLTANTG